MKIEVVDGENDIVLMVQLLIDQHYAGAPGDSQRLTRRREV